MVGATNTLPRSTGMDKASATRAGVSMYQNNVLTPEDNKTLLRRIKKHNSNTKMAGSGHSVWRAGAFKGLPLYQLSLEERATCPTGCSAWEICYGNNMPFAYRVNPQNNEELFLNRLISELDQLDMKHPLGYSLRLHVLGDFYSVGYVRFWASQLRFRPQLHIYGYTHRVDEIGDAIHVAWQEFGERFNILQSDTFKYARPAAMLEGTPGAEMLPICPEQTNKVDGCLDCGLCTNKQFNGVRFLTH